MYLNLLLFYINRNSCFNPYLYMDNFFPRDKKKVSYNRVRSHKKVMYSRKMFKEKRGRVLSVKISSKNSNQIWLLFYFLLIEFFIEKVKMKLLVFNYILWKNYFY